MQHCREVLATVFDVNYTVPIGYSGFDMSVICDFYYPYYAEALRTYD